MRNAGDETINSLQFGSRAMCVRNKPVINEVLDLHLVEALQEADSQKERAYELESLLEREQEERSKLEAALAEEKRRFQAIIDALKAEATQVGAGFYKGLRHGVCFQHSACLARSGRRGPSADWRRAADVLC